MVNVWEGNCSSCRCSEWAAPFPPCRAVKHDRNTLGRGRRNIKKKKKKSKKEKNLRVKMKLVMTAKRWDD